MSRDRIQAHLWPESSADRARHALDQLLYATRRDLGHEAILSTATDLRLNPALVRPDLWSFESAVAAGEWAVAAALYGGPLLSGQHLIDSAEFEHWLDGERARVEQEYHRALEALAVAAAARGDHAEAVRRWRQRASADPLSAPAALQLMRALAAAGDRAAAIRHARVHQRLVRDQLEIDPDPAVEALATQLADVPAADRVHAVPPGRTEALTADTAQVVTSESAQGHARQEPPPRLAHAGALAIAICAVIAALLVASRPRRAEPEPAPVPPPSRVAAADTAAVAAGAAGAAAVRPTSAAHRTADPRARELYLRARRLWELRTKQGLERAVVLYRQATERDPLYADAYTGLAESYAMLGYFGFGPGDAMFPKARAAALRALELDPTAGAAYAALGQALAWEHAWADAERAYLRALELAPENPTAHQWYALLLAYVGRAKEAAVHTGHASRLDPLSVQINNMHGMMLYYAGDIDAALRQYERTVDAEPDSAWVRQNPWVLSNFGEVATAAGRYEQAVRLLQRSLDVVPTHPRPLLDLAYAYIRMGDTARARAVFARADTTHPHYVVARASLHALLGEMDEAFAWFDRVKEWALPSLVGLNNNPRFAPLRADPRYAKIRQRLGMPSR